MSQLPPIDLTGKVALIAGGAGEIGEAIAGGFGSAGAELAVADTGPERLERIAMRLGSATFECDFGDQVQIGELFASVRERFGRLDVLVCAQGGEPEPRGFLDLPFRDYRTTLALNLDATFLCVQKAAQVMAAGDEGGRIIALARLNALASQRGAADHDVAQAGLRGLVKAAAGDLASRQITINGILVGPLHSELPEGRIESAGETALNPRGLVGDPEDVARAALWLADPYNGFVTGSLILVDGGQSSLLPLP